MKTPAKVHFDPSICNDETKMFAVYANFGTRRLSSKKPVIKVIYKRKEWEGEID